MSNINEAFLLLVVGMTTVFIILLFVIYMSRLLIMAVNRFAPEISPTVSPAQKPKAVSSSLISKPIMVAITTAINLASEGKATILKIEKK